MKSMVSQIITLLQDKILQKIFKGSFWNGIGLIAAKLLMCGSMMLFARMLSPKEFGVWGYLYGMLLTLLMFVDGPWSATITKYVAEYRNKEKEKTGQLIAFFLLMMIPAALLATATAFIFSKQIAVLINHAEQGKAIALFLLSLIPLGILSILKGVINGRNYFINCFISVACCNVCNELC